MNRNSLRILAGLVIGFSIGTILSGGPSEDAVGRWAQPVGKLWLDALTMTVVPLVFSLLVSGVMNAASHASDAAVAARSLMWFALLLLAASLLSIGVTLLALQVSPLPQAAHALPASAGPASDIHLPSDWLGAIIPTNVVQAAASTAMVPLVVFALLLGVAATRIEDDLAQHLERTFRGIAQAMLVIVQWVLWLAPLGVFALGIGVGLRLGGSAAGVLAHYVVVIIVACLAAAILSYVAAVLFGRIGLLAFARAALPAQAIAISTQSSLASLPAMVEAAEPLGISKTAAGVVLPLAVSLFRAASAGANMAVAIYLAHVHGVPLAAGPLLLAAVVAAAVSVAAVGLPAQVSFFAIIAPVCLALGVPVTLLPLLLAIETLPDVFRTLGNVTADLAVARIVARKTTARPL